MDRNLKIALIPKHQYIKMRDPALTSVDPMGFNPISKWRGHRFSRQSSPPHNTSFANWQVRKKRPVFKYRKPEYENQNIGTFLHRLYHKNKLRKNCECSLGHSLAVSHLPSMSRIEFLNMSGIVNCVTKSLNCLSSSSSLSQKHHMTQ